MSLPNGRHVPVGGRDAARALIAARRAEAARSRTTRSEPLGTSPVAMGLIRHGRAIIAAVAGAAALVILFAAWLIGDGDVLTEQLEVFALALVGVYLTGVAAVAFWAHERRRELVRLTDVERYVVAVAERLGLVGVRLVDDPRNDR